MRFTVTPIKSSSQIPQASSVSAVFLLATTDNGIIVTHHKKRGWDIPGGHVEKGETIEQALRREMLEEAGLTFTDARPIAIILNDGAQEKYADKVMLVFTSKNYFLSDNFVPAEDVMDRKIMKISEFITSYQGDKEVLQSILRCASIREN